jgi:hypothetical protein
MSDRHGLRLLEHAYRSIEETGLSETVDAFCHELANRPDFLSALLLDLAEPELFATIRASHHPIGFYSTVLSTQKRKDVPSARFIWLEQGQRFAEDIHDHAYDFAAIVVHGSVTERLFAEHDGARYRKYRFDGHLIDTNTTADVSEVASFIAHAGCRYQLHHDQLHVTAPASETAGLLMFRSRYRRFESRVLALQPRAPIPASQDLTYGEFASLVSRVRDLMKTA